MGKYSETLMDHVMAPRNGGGMENPDLTGTPVCWAQGECFGPVSQERNGRDRHFIDTASKPFVAARVISLEGDRHFIVRS